MSTQVLDRSPEPLTRLSIVDCDIHPTMKSLSDLDPWLEKRWQEHIRTYGEHMRQGLSKTLMHPRMQPAVSRGDAWPPTGGPPGSYLPFMQEQHLDPNGVTFGVLQTLRPNGNAQRNVEFGAALCTAANEWQMEIWTRRDRRLKGSILVTPEWPEAAVAEIERRAGNRDFVQAALPPRTDEPLGRRRYWPIYRAAAEAGLPIGLHVSGTNGHPSTGAGWPSYYIEEHHSNVQMMQGVVTSLVMEGVFEQFPGLKIVLIEGGFAWVPALAWRLDKHWARMRGEVPHVKRPPSEYIRTHFWFTTQPVEEPENPRHMIDLIDWIGEDRLLFSTDYPHWDFDDPRYAFKVPLDERRKAKIFRGNAQALYGLG
jgi:predicted TIM-barrel fold metal-dependent hydrolase